MYQTLTFLKFIRNCPITSNDKIMVSFDIVSLYTNVPLQATAQICVDALCRGCLSPLSIQDLLFLEFLTLATKEGNLALKMLCMTRQMVFLWVAL